MLTTPAKSFWDTSNIMNTNHSKDASNNKEADDSRDTSCLWRKCLAGLVDNYQKQFG